MERVKLHRFRYNRDVTYEYHYSSDGTLKLIRASLHYWGYWIAEADLPLNPDISQSPEKIRYYKTRIVGDMEIQEITYNPDFKGYYQDELNAAPRWMAAQQLPCADKLV